MPCELPQRQVTEKTGAITFLGADPKSWAQPWAENDSRGNSPGSPGAWGPGYMGLLQPGSREGMARKEPLSTLTHTPLAGAPLPVSVRLRCRGSPRGQGSTSPGSGLDAPSTRLPQSRQSSHAAPGDSACSASGAWPGQVPP